MMAPPFAYRWQAWLFAGFIAFFLLLPFLPKPDWMDRSVLYLSTHGPRNSYRYLAENILKNTDDIDVLILGPSATEAALNPVLIKDALRPTIDHEPVVYAVGHPLYSLYYDFIALKDILSKHRVKMLLWFHEYQPIRSNVPVLPYLWDFHLHGEPISQLPAKERQEIYTMSMMAGMRLVLAPFKDHLRPIYIDKCPHQNKYFGGCMRKEGQKALAHVVPPNPPDLSAEEMIFPGSPRNILKYVAPYPPNDRIFSDAIFKLAQEHGTYVSFINVPNRIQALPRDKLLMYKMVEGQLGRDAPVIAVTANDLFQDISLKEAVKYFTDKDYRHFHWAMAQYYTRIVSPAIVELYRRATQAETSPPLPDKQ